MIGDIAWLERFETTFIVRSIVRFIFSFKPKREVDDWSDLNACEPLLLLLDMLLIEPFAVTLLVDRLPDKDLLSVTCG